MKKKIWAAALALTLVAGIAVGGTVAWLIDETQEVTNTFSPSTINITLTETAATDGADDDSLVDSAEFKMVPGATIEKDPKVTVEAGSEACWLFVKIEKANDFDTYMTYEMADGWTELDGETGVYYRQVNTAGESFAVLKCIDDNHDETCGGCVKVREGVTKTQMNALTDDTLPTLTFTAYAVQQLGFETAAAAWVEAEKLDTTVADPTT